MLLFSMQIPKSLPGVVFVQTLPAAMMGGLVAIKLQLDTTVHFNRCVDGWTNGIC